MSDTISRQVLDLWNKYKPTIAVDAIEYDRELRQLLGTNLASLGTDCISRQAAIDALRGYLVEKRCPDDGTLTCRLIENEVINKLPPAQPKRGRWERGFDGNHAVCSNCQAWWIPFGEGYKTDYHFCPNCGSYNGGEYEI